MVHTELPSVWAADVSLDTELEEKYLLEKQQQTTTTNNNNNNKHKC
jgi:hypothetical protein